MKFIRKSRTFKVSKGRIVLKDCGDIYLEPNEQVTFKTKCGSEYDVVKKSWGFYATPSLNKRLPDHGFNPKLIKATDGKFHIALVEKGYNGSFGTYLLKEGYCLVAHLDVL